MEKKKVLFVLNIPSPYRIKFLNMLSEKCHLTVAYERTRAIDRDVKWVENSIGNYETFFLNGKYYKSDSTISFSIKRFLKDNKYDHIIFGNFSTPTGIIGINYCIRKKIDYSLEGDGAFYTKHFFKDIIKKRIIKHAKYCFSTCKNLDKYFYSLGAKKERIVRYHFASLTKDEFENNRLLDNKSDFKKKIGINSKKVILYVGQFIKRKGVDVLLKSFINVNNDATLLLIGGKMTQEYAEIIKTNGLQNVVVIDFVRPSELPKYYQIADIFVLPTREDIWGLVVNEALSYGLPVITTTKCNAGLELIVDEYNGYLVEPENEILLSECIEKLLDNKIDLRLNCIASIKDYSIERMVDDHMKVFENGK